MPLLKLRDFFHLPQVDALIGQLAHTPGGLCLVAGLDARQPASQVTRAGAAGEQAPQAAKLSLPGAAGGQASHSAKKLMPGAARLLPSGRSGIFWVLVEEIVESRPELRCKVVALERETVRVPRGLKERLQLVPLQAQMSFAEQAGRVAARRPDLLVFDHLTAESLAPAFSAALQGLWVISQVDSPFYGEQVAHQLAEMGASPSDLELLGWVLSLQRLPTLCPDCRRPVENGATLVERLHPAHLQATGVEAQTARFYRAGACPACQNSGRRGDVLAFDLTPGRAAGPAAPRLPMPAYILNLAGRGLLAIDDYLDFEGLQTQRAYRLLADSEQALGETTRSLESRLVQLEAANRVLRRQTNALISMQEIGQALIESSDLHDLAGRLCRRTAEICRADRAVLYYQTDPAEVRVLASTGWPAGRVPARLPAAELRFFRANQVSPLRGLPPGILPGQEQDPAPRAGLYAPLFAGGAEASGPDPAGPNLARRIGWLVVQSTQRQAFDPGESALLTTFAQQAALALQRAGLTEQLKAKIAQLEAAQAELRAKARLEHEMELARQVQRSLLPATFPAIPGFQFAALSEPARRVGGDFYDLFSLDAGHFGLAIADVSDKGLGAAMYMALTRSLLRAEARRERSPAAVAANVNRLLLELGEATNFVTLFCGVVEHSPAGQQLIYTRAGHDRPLLLRGGEASELPGDGAALGLLEPEEFACTQETLALQPGDRLVLFTDGVFDILDGRGAPFGRTGFTALLQAHAHLPAGELAAAVMAALHTYQGQTELYDDMTLLIVAVD